MQNHMRSTVKPSIATYVRRTNDGGIMELSVLECRRNHGKGIKIEMNKASWTIVKKTTFLARFDD